MAMGAGACMLGTEDTIGVAAAKSESNGDWLPETIAIVSRVSGAFG
jgi:hypothetical protein